MDDLKIKKLLFDVQNAIQSIEDFIGEPRIFENYTQNKMLRNAVERNIEIMGEAINQISKIDNQIPISNARRIVDTRNKIIHGYDEV